MTVNPAFSRLRLSCWRDVSKSINLCRILSAAITGMCLAGCQGEPEETHLEHYTPSHRPSSFAEAVEQLQYRIAREVGTTTPPGPDSDEFQQLRDIIEWLPEIAADTDLKKPDWDSVSNVARKLAGWHSRHQRDGQTDFDNRQNLESDLALLQSLIPNADSMANRASSTR